MSVLKYVTLSYEILGHMGIHFWDVCYFENISLADYFAIKTKTAVKYILKLWLFEVAKCYGSHFGKMALKDCVILLYCLAMEV